MYGNSPSFGSLSSPGDGIVRITLLTQVKKEREERYKHKIGGVCQCEVGRFANNHW